MKMLDAVLFALGALGLAFCLYVGFSNPSAPEIQMTVLSVVSAVLALAGYLGWRIGRQK